MVTFWGLGFLVFYGISYYGFQRMRHCQGSLLDMFTPGRYTPCAGTTDQAPGSITVNQDAPCPPGYKLTGHHGTGRNPGQKVCGPA